MSIVEITTVANGGRCIAHLDGKTVFVRGALPGEKVRVQITDRKSKIAFATVTEVLESSPDRVEPPCAYASQCGGCDFQHVEPKAQGKLLNTMLHDTYRRIAGVELETEVHLMDSPFGWRTRMSFAVNHHAQACMRGSRSHDLVPITQCLIAHPDLPKVLEQVHPREETVFAATSSTGQSTTDPKSVLVEKVRGRTFRHRAGGFWQVHPDAPALLVDAVLRLGTPRPGERIVDLYSGTGLFSAFLAEAVGPQGSVLAVEADTEAVGLAEKNLEEFDFVDVICAAVGNVEFGHANLVVLDPPRAGAKEALDEIVHTRPHRIVYVSCDLATGARDVKTLLDAGYKLSAVEAFGIFPMTAHIETVLLLTRSDTD